MKYLRIVLIALLILAAAGYAGYRISLRTLKSGVVEALGPHSEVRDIRIGWAGVNIEGLRIRGTASWPSKDTFRADRVVIVPDIRSLLSDTYRIRSITIERPYLSIVRTRKGKLVAVPSLLEGQEKEKAQQAGPPEKKVDIGRISLRDAEMELFDETLGHKGKKIRVQDIHADLHDFQIPGFTSRSSFELTGTMKGSRQDGSIVISGWVVPSTKDSSVSMKLRSLELSGLQPYFSKSKDVRVQGGTIDLDLQSDVRDSRLKAPGRVTFADLKLAPSRGRWGSFMGMPRDAVLTMLKDKGGRITLDFVLEGDISNPKFSLNESLSTRMAVSMADTFKAGIGDMAKDVGSLGEKGVDAATGVMKGVGKTVNSLFNSGKKE